MNMRLFVRANALAGLFIAGNLSFAQNWTQTSAPIPNLIWPSLASSADGNHIVAAANTPTSPYNGPTYNSADSGATWTSNAFSSKRWESIASSADGIKLVATANGIVYTSANSGVAWKTALLAADFSGVASSADGSKLAAAAENKIFTSTNSGETWRSNNVPNIRRSAGISLACSADGNKLIAGDYSGSIYTSADGGGTWASNSLTKMKQLFVASSANGDNLAAAAGGQNIGNGPIYISTNSGTAWMTSSAPNQMWVSIASSADGTKLIAAAAPNNNSSNLIFTSSDLGFTWTSNNVPAVGLGWACVACSADGNKLMAGSFYGGIWDCQITSAPSLHITSCGTACAVSWMVPSTDFLLQQNSDLGTTNWAALNNTPTLNFTNLQNQVILAAPADSSFYRLIGRARP